MPDWCWVSEFSMSASDSEHDYQTLQGLTFVWALALAGMIAIVAVIALSEVGGDALTN